MARTGRRGVAAVLLSAVLLAGRAGADSPSAEDIALRVDAHLAVGEFAPALTLAHSAAPERLRNALFDRVAAAQLAAGARAPSLSTASRITDDEVRAAAADRVARAPIAPPGGPGGGLTEADFEPVLNLITDTIAPTSWDKAGGPGSVKGFPNGVWIDPSGLLRQQPPADDGADLAAVRLAGSPPKGLPPGTRDARVASPLRKVSLTRLEKQVQLALAAGRQPTEAMRVLAGLTRVKFLLVYPESRDIVLAGPAGDWNVGAEGRILSSVDGRPVLLLDDLVVLLRQSRQPEALPLGCSISPTEEGLARTRAFAAESARSKLGAKERGAWLEKLRASLGRQEIEIFGLDPHSRAAQVLVEADYRMKLVGLGLEEAVVGVRSYLDLASSKAAAPPALNVLRWWFALDYQAVRTTPDRDAFQLRGQGVRVLSENQLLEATGRRVATGEADPLSREFADSFTRHFDALAAKYPVYAELQNICDLALVAALLRTESLAERVGWRLTCFGRAERFAVAQGPIPRHVESVVAHRVVDRTHILAAVSGGVRVDPARWASRAAMETDSYGKLAADRAACAPSTKHLPPDAWWWD